jgi:arylformamidase
VRYYDISLNLSPDTVRWVVAPPFEVHERRRMSRGDHFVPDGAGIDTVPLARFMGPALVHPVDADRFITEAHVKAIPLDGETRVLFKTRNSQLLKRREYDPNFVAFSVDAARALVARGVKLIGLDYLSVAHADEQVPVHRAFLDHGVVVLEGVDLSEIAPGRYELICFPLKLRGLDGAPCRAVLRELS